MRRIVAPLSIVLLLAACGAGTAPAPELTPPRRPLDAAVSPVPAPQAQALDTERREAFNGLSTETLHPDKTLVAMSIGDTDVFRSPADTAPMLTLPHTTILGTVSVFEVVEGPIEGWLRVMVPVRPNGTEGWVVASEVMMYVVDGRFVIDLSARTLSYYERGELVLSTEIAVGSDRNPTPMGDFFVTDNVTLDDPESAWGPHALGISARSETITEYNGGDGIIGIHGTNRPGSIGNAASLGCIRVPNQVIKMLHEIVPMGTPVEINA